MTSQHFTYSAQLYTAVHNFKQLAQHSTHLHTTTQHSSKLYKQSLQGYTTLYKLFEKKLITTSEKVYKSSHKYTTLHNLTQVYALHNFKTTQQYIKHMQLYRT